MMISASQYDLMRKLGFLQPDCRVIIVSHRDHWHRLSPANHCVVGSRPDHFDTSSFDDTLREFEIVQTWCEHACHIEVAFDETATDLTRTARRYEHLLPENVGRGGEQRLQKPGTKPEPKRMTTPAVTGETQQLVIRVQQASRLRQGNLPQLRQRRPVGRLDHQGSADEFLQSVHLSCKGWLRKSKPPRRPTQTSGLSDRNKRTQGFSRQICETPPHCPPQVTRGPPSKYVLIASLANMHLPITSRTDIEELSSDGRPFGRLPRMVPHQDLDVLPDNLGPPEIHKATALQPLRRCELAARMVIFGRKASGIQRRNEMAATALIRATNSTVRGIPVMLAQTSVLLLRRRGHQRDRVHSAHDAMWSADVPLIVASAPRCPCINCHTIGYSLSCLQLLELSR